ncbi:hypothetical protein GCM10027512_15430 [Chromohalobacter beijerinckii]
MTDQYDITELTCFDHPANRLGQIRNPISTARRARLTPAWQIRHEAQVPLPKCRRYVHPCAARTAPVVKKHERALPSAMLRDVKNGVVCFDRHGLYSE